MSALPKGSTGVVSWLRGSAVNCGVTYEQMRLWFYKGLIPLPSVVARNKRLIGVVSPPITALPEGLPPKRGAPYNNTNSSRLRRKQKEERERACRSEDQHEIGRAHV